MPKIIGTLAALALMAATPAMAQGTMEPEAPAAAPAKEAKPAAKKTTKKHAHKKTAAKPEAAQAPASK
jgi:hypothetical protein